MLRSLLEHPAMMQMLRDIEQAAPGFMEMRKMVHAWALERETLMRSGRIRDILKASGLNFPADKAAHQRVLDVLEKAVDADKVEGERTMKQVEERLLRQTVGDLNSHAVENILDKIAKTEDLKLIAGPYTPFTRRGDYAISGQFVLKTPDGAIRTGACRQPADQRED